MIPAFYNPLSSADGGGMIVAGLHEDIEDGAILIDGAPQVVDGAVDMDEHLTSPHDLLYTCFTDSWQRTTRSMTRFSGNGHETRSQFDGNSAAGRISMCKPSAGEVWYRATH